MATKAARETKINRISARPSSETERLDANLGITECDHCRPAGVLIIEDERHMLKAMEQGLRKRGFVVWTSFDGHEGINVYRRFGAQIDIVLSDVQMPVLDGPKTLDALREINPSVKLCFMTGDIRTSTHINLLNRGALRVFAKTALSVAEVAEEIWKLATRPQDVSVDIEFGNVDSADSEHKASKPLKRSACNGSLRSLFYSQFCALVGIGSLRGQGRRQPPIAVPPT